MHSIRSLKLSIHEHIPKIEKYLSNRLKNTRVDMDNNGEQGTIEQPKKLKNYFNPQSHIDFLQSPICKQDIRLNIF